MKMILIALLMNFAFAQAQTVVMTKGQPFPFGSGLALSEKTADSTKNYVHGLQRDYIIEIGRNRDLEMRYGTLQLEHNNQSTGYQGLQAQYNTIKPEYDQCQKVKKRRFWIGLGIGVVGTLLGREGIKRL